MTASCEQITAIFSAPELLLREVAARGARGAAGAFPSTCLQFHGFQLPQRALGLWNISMARTKDILRNLGPAADRRDTCARKVKTWVSQFIALRTARFRNRHNVYLLGPMISSASPGTYHNVAKLRSVSMRSMKLTYEIVSLLLNLIVQKISDYKLWTKAHSCQIKGLKVSFLKQS